jgi:hypothetical protein
MGKESKGERSRGKESRVKESRGKESRGKESWGKESRERVWKRDKTLKGNGRRGGQGDRQASIF